MEKVFVYGTLKTGHNNWARFLAPQVGRPAYLMGHALHEGPGFPYMVWTNVDTDFTYGETFEVDAETLERLDRLEGVAVGHYRREKVAVKTGRGWEQVWTYVVETPFGCLGPKVEFGDWSPERR